MILRKSIHLSDNTYEREYFMFKKENRIKSLRELPDTKAIYKIRCVSIISIAYFNSIYVKSFVNNRFKGDSILTNL